MNVAGLLNIIRRECQRVLAQRATTRMGIVDSYDPDLYCAKVLLQPENVLTGFLPIATEWVGNGWGEVFGLTPGDVVDVHFQEGGKNAGYISKRFYSTVTRPPGPVPSGESWRVHKSGSFLKFTNDGKVSVNSASDMDFVSEADINMTAAGKINLDAENELILHGGNKANLDAGGVGISYQSNHIDTYTDGILSDHHSPNPPQIPT
jgi:hypothetical protein